MLNRNFTADCLKVDEVFSMRQTLKEMHYKNHHEVAMRGYISRKWSAGLCEYSGYLLVFPRFDTTNYVRAEYWVR